ncbi:MAG: amidophosphoribosyltransferase, partial [Acinetobacter sp.]|nr:amidophosphoribosyltransferase [Acinetobacter sp.]
TTCNEIIQMAREAGAKNVFFASAAPMVKYPNVYGIDMPAKSELIASNRSVDEICQIIEADRLIFQDLDDLKAAVQTSKVPHLTEFDCSVFDGVYVTGGINDDYLTALERQRNDSAKKKKDGYIDVNIDASAVDLTGIKGS